ncbi:MAG: hypothetical protein RR376_10195 [Janthinobacterium sp.]|jgi:hypothetical protein
MLSILVNVIQGAHRPQPIPLAHGDGGAPVSVAFRYTYVAKSYKNFLWENVTKIQDL